MRETFLVFQLLKLTQIIPTKVVMIAAEMVPYIVMNVMEKKELNVMIATEMERIVKAIHVTHVTEMDT